MWSFIFNEMFNSGFFKATFNFIGIGSMVLLVGLCLKWLIVGDYEYEEE